MGKAQRNAKEAIHQNYEPRIRWGKQVLGAAWGRSALIGIFERLQNLGYIPQAVA
jgi:hypothetical protein